MNIYNDNNFVCPTWKQQICFQYIWLYDLTDFYCKTKFYGVESLDRLSYNISLKLLEMVTHILFFRTEKVSLLLK